MSVRSGWVAIVFLLAGAFTFVVGGLFAVAFMVEGGCGATYGYYGCDAPTPNAGMEADRAVAHARRP